MNAVESGVELDAQLMFRSRDGDAQSFGVLVERNYASVIHFLYRIVQNRAIAEELAQEVFLRVYRARASYEPRAKFTTWLFQICTYLALNWLRDQRHECQRERLVIERNQTFCFELPDRSPNVEERLVWKSRAQEIRAAIHELPAKQRTAVLMHKYQEMNYAQISMDLGCSESAVKSLLFRAYERLRCRLAHLSVR
jgi:RNA polymerase sigma-70 factor, ECF subfamily